MYELNAEYLEDERSNLDISLSTPIIVLADLGLWDGRRVGYKMIDSGNIKDCLSSNCDYNEWFVDGKGELRCTAAHHDGTNHYRYRAIRKGIPDWRVERLQDRLYEGKATETDIERVTKRLGDEIAAVYGFEIPSTDKKEGIEMEQVNAVEEQFEKVEILDMEGLFTELRIDKSTVPENVYCYELRHGDDDSFAVAVERNVAVNFFGSLLMTKELHMDEQGKISMGYDDFGFAGEDMTLEAFLKESREKEFHVFQSGKELAEFLGDTFSITDVEGNKLLDYMEGHGYVLGEQNGEMHWGNLCDTPGETVWEPCSIDDAVNAVAEWNFEMIKQEAAKPDAEENRLKSLREDEQILDAVFDRTKYGKEVDMLAEVLVEELFQDMKKEGGLDAAIEKMAEQIKAGEDLLPDISPALKKNNGRGR